MYDFHYVRPASVADAVKALAAEEAQAISGGQTLIPTLKARLGRPSSLVDLSKIAEMKGIDASGAFVTIKAATTHGAIAADAGVAGAIPALAHLAAHIGDPAVRNRGTIGGSVANNDPAACWPAAVLGLGATVHTDRREIPADQWFKGMFETALDRASGEIVTAIRFPVPQKAAYQKFVQPASRFALTGVFVAKFMGAVRVAVTGASEKGCFRWAAAEAALSRSFAPEAIDALAAPDASGMIGDIHGAPDYRAHLVKVMTRRAVAAC